MTRTTNCWSSLGGQRRPSLVRRVACRIGLMAATLGVTTLSGCEEDFDPASKLQTLRILAVQADKPYPQPGETVQLEMLWHDGKSPPDSPRPVEVVWLGACFNPPGDLYYRCFDQLEAKLSAIEDDPSLINQLLGVGDSFSIDVPQDLISGRPTAEGTDPYGLTVIFFAACAGQIRPAEPAEDGLPLGCFDPEGNRLGADDYVPGYMMLYSYEGRTNANPVLYGLEVDGQLIEAGTEPTYPRCSDQQCRELKLRAAVDPASAETNTGLFDGDGNALSEQMWVEYLATGGDVDRSPRLVNDASKGFNEDNGTDYSPPWESGRQYIFVVVRDNRGGVAWVKQAIRFE